jgi:hypothetical protein
MDLSLAVQALVQRDERSGDHENGRHRPGDGEAFRSGG